MTRIKTDEAALPNDAPQEAAATSVPVSVPAFAPETPPALPSEGGSYIRQADGSLIREEEG